MDGAHVGVGARRALGTILGDKEQPTSRERKSPAQVRSTLRRASMRPKSYNTTANTAGKLVLEFMERHPESASMPADSKYEWPRRADGEIDFEGTPTITVEGVYEYMKRIEPEWYIKYKYIWTELTGFMWGWAVNAARYSLDLPPVSNPALLTIEIDANEARISKIQSNE